ncbi:pyrimidine dimer DNA glycosylase /DNA-(apurinic or apyrimidinic site) lyase [Microbacterium faecale]|uniref:Pyrimidine dimer DNA glycosylase /DNA-(Apurinic or apyrimidinic site) lyase n=1 Tax=Microbacterium faecale TaxID=1804630 RepID=A0A916YD75_9MICO|nr:pyrimidine dimer DNA glycosylase/endonuclease V [Microbacterium faecale]GGD40181.1 pyrimidine dimer DNA glycosylase /DNA-(apurinic or apyrimidinic site) lyase [Microbacterium faecale]
MHPRYFDRQALTACWREGLLAQAVIAEPGRGYSRHPQLRRFRQADDPRAAIGDYLSAIADEADARGYHFARGKVRVTGAAERLTLNDGQLVYEWAHLRSKLRARSPDVWARWQTLICPDPHPSFVVINGPIADWEKVTPHTATEQPPEQGRAGESENPSR